MSSSSIISVIIPVYNAEKWLRRCLKSLQAQTFTDFEAILIDDGSTDNSGKICDEIATEDSRFRVIHQMNQGVSAVRQTGLDVACGKYVIYCDSDDWVESDMLDNMHQKALETDSDVVICDWFMDTQKGSEYQSMCPKSFKHEDILLDFCQDAHGALWNKLWKRECFNKYHVRFPVGLRFSEDAFVNICLAQYLITASHISKAFYHYCHDNTESLTSLELELELERTNKYKSLLSERLLPETKDLILATIENRTAEISLIAGLHLEQFQETHQSLRKKYFSMNIPLKRKIYLCIAFTFSAELSHKAIGVYNRLKHH